MARKRGRKRSTSRKRSARGRAVVVYSNKPKRTARRRYRRNGSSLMKLGGRGIVGETMNLAIGGLIGGATNVAGEMTGRLARQHVFGETAGTTLAAVEEVGVGIAGGLLIEMLGKGKAMAHQIAHDFVSGTTGGVIRGMLRQMNNTTINAALADSGPRVIRPRRGNARLSSYPRSLSSWPGTPALAGMVTETERELGYG